MSLHAHDVCRSLPVPAFNSVLSCSHGAKHRWGSYLHDGARRHLRMVPPVQELGDAGAPRLPEAQGWGGQVAPADARTHMAGQMVSRHACAAAVRRSEVIVIISIISHCRDHGRVRAVHEEEHRVCAQRRLRMWIQKGLSGGLQWRTHRAEGQPGTRNEGKVTLAATVRRSGCVVDMRARRLRSLRCIHQRAWCLFFSVTSAVTYTQVCYVRVCQRFDGLRRERNSQACVCGWLGVCVCVCVCVCVLLFDIVVWLLALFPFVLLHVFFLCYYGSFCLSV